MVIVLYVITTVLFCIGAFVVPKFFMPLIWGYESLAKKSIIHPTDPAFLMLFMGATIVLLHLTRYIWALLGYKMGWLFLTLILVLHVIMGSRSVGNNAHQAQAIGVVMGVAGYWGSRLF
jgi:hypothetical protein